MVQYLQLHFPPAMRHFMIATTFKLRNIVASFSSTLAPNSAQTTAERPAALSIVTVLVVAMWAILAVGLCNAIMFSSSRREIASAQASEEQRN